MKRTAAWLPVLSLLFASGAAAQTGYLQEAETWGAAGSGPGEFDAPVAIDVDPQGFVYVLERGGDRVQRFTAEGEFVAVWGAPGNGPGEMNEPSDLAVVPRGNEVWVCDEGNRRVLRFTREGDFVAGWGAGVLVAPGAITFGPEGRVYVLDAGKVAVLDRQANVIASFGAPELPFNVPENLVVAASGEIFVADGDGRVHHLTAAGELVQSSWAAFDLKAVAVDHAGNVYSASFLAENFYDPIFRKLAPDGSVLAEWGWTDTWHILEDLPPSTPIWNATDVVVAYDGSVYGVSMFANRVYRYWPQGSLVTTHPAGVPVRIDGETHATPAVFPWEAGSRHTVSVPEHFEHAPGSRRDFEAWEDGSPREREVVASGQPEQWTAEYGTSHFLTMEASAGGTVSPASAWIPESTVVAIAATPDAGWRLDTWTASDACATGAGYCGYDPAATIVMDAPRTQRAEFSRPRYDLSISASATDPTVNTAAPAGGLRPLYLWVSCSSAAISFFEAGIAESDSLGGTGFTPAPGVTSLPSNGTLRLEIDACDHPVGEPLLLGQFTSFDMGGELCLQPTPGGILAATDCHPKYPQPFDVRVTGFSSSAVAPCVVGTNGCSLPREPSAEVPDPESERRSALRPESAVVLAPHAVSPNPFTDGTSLSLSLPEAARLQATVYDVTGRRIRTLASGVHAPGTQRIEWDGRDSAGRQVPVGVYFLRVEAGERHATRKLVRVER